VTFIVGADAVEVGLSVGVGVAVIVGVTFVVSAAGVACGLATAVLVAARARSAADPATARVSFFALLMCRVYAMCPESASAR
jgi:hypothetical protein